MGAVVFDNHVFDSWLTKKSEEILYKVDRTTISTEEMLTLILKAQTNHFHHMDVEFRGEFNKIEERFTKIDQRFEKLEDRIEEQFAKVEERFAKAEARNEERLAIFEARSDASFTNFGNILKWQVGVIIALFAGIYLKLFLG